MNIANLTKLKLIWERFRAEENGQDLVEYAFLLAFLSVVSISMMRSVGGSLGGLLSTFERVTSSAGAWSGS